MIASKPEDTVDIWDNPAFVEWFNDRPPAVQEVIRQCPLGELYKLHTGAFPSQILSYDENEDGSVTMTVRVASPFFPRSVFGVKPEDLKPWEEGS